MNDQYEATPQNLYQITGNVADINTVLIERSELRTLQARIDELEAQPTENLRCKSTQKRLAMLWGYVKQEPARQPLPADTYTALAHRIATKYAHRSDPAFCGYAFLPHTLEQFVRAIEQAHNITGGQ